jgi:hypothetical protein
MAMLIEDIVFVLLTRRFSSRRVAMELHGVEADIKEQPGRILVLDFSAKCRIMSGHGKVDSNGPLLPSRFIDIMNMSTYAFGLFGFYTTMV